MCRVGPQPPNAATTRHARQAPATAPSVYHLVPRREPHPALRRAVQHFDLPPSGVVCLSTPVGINSPSVRKRTRHPLLRRQHRPPRRWRTAARPRATQRLAAELVVRNHGLGRAHIGAICDALLVASIDPTAWSAHAITDPWTPICAPVGWTWPDHIYNPRAFLSSRLLRLTLVTSQSPAEERPLRCRQQ